MTAPILVSGQIVAAKYTVTTLLRSDGAVATYHAITAPSRDVALKVFDPRLLSDPVAMAERERVAKAIADLPESLTLPVVAQGIDPEENAPFTATTSSAHPSLAQLVLLCPLTLVETVTVLRSVGRALDEAQRRGVAHGALKPSNVFVGPPAAYATHVVDFGATSLRRALAARGVGAVRVTWLAPEQVASDGDARSDVFAAGLVVFFALTGRSFWRCAPAEGEPDGSAWKAEVAEVRARASDRGAEIGKPVDAAVDPVIARALATKPADRYASVSELAEALAVAAGMAPVAGAAIPQRSPGADVLPSVVPTVQAFAPMAPPAPPPAAVAAAPAVAPAPAFPIVSSVAADVPSEPPPGIPRRRTGVIAAILGVLVLGGAAVAFVLTHGERPEVAATVASSAPIAAPPAPPPSASAPAEMPDASALVEAPDAAADAASDAARDAARDAAPDAAASQADILVTCRPACPNVRIDGKTVDDPTAPTPVTAGAHTIAITPPSGFLPQTKKVTVKKGEHAKVTLVLSSARAAGPGPSAPCGKFLKRCN